MSECVKNNTCSSSSSSSSCSDFYERHVMYAPADILNVCKAEDEEQNRRCADKEGENHKRILAHNMSVMLGENLRATWFQRGSSFVLSLLGGVRSAVAHKASDITTVVSDKAGDLGHRASLRISSTADEMGIKAQAKAQEVSNTISHKAGEVGLMAQEKAHQLSDSIAHKAGETASSVSSQAQAAALNIKDMGFEKAHEARSWFSEMTQEYTQKLKEAVTSTFFYKKLGSFTGRTNMTFALLEEEAERAFRMNDASEIYRIENSLKVASLFKALHPELYCMRSNPDIYYSTRLLEEAERSRRISEDKCDKAAIVNAKAVCDIVCQKLSAGERITSKKAESKVEPAVEEIKKPIAAAM